MKTLEESVGKIKNRRKQGYQNHSTLSKNALEPKYGPKNFLPIFAKVFFRQTLQGFHRFFYLVPRVVASLQPWAGISERLRRIANAFGV